MSSSITVAAMPCVCLPQQRVDEKGNLLFDEDGKPVFEEEAVLMQDWVFQIRGHWFNIPAGTTTDGASIPRWLWRVCGHPLKTPRVYAALMHDWLYRNGFQVPSDIDRKEADACYRDMLKYLGWGSVKAAVEYRALRWFGDSSWVDREISSTTNKENKQ